MHFRDAPDEAMTRDLVGRIAGAGAAAALTFAPVATADWVKKSLAGLKPVDAGRFAVHGAHDRDKIAAHRIGIEIEAALAFGTGHHGTTRGCLLALDAVARQRRPRCVLDIGTGSGVLAIAAARRLRARVLASDIDPQAVSAARENARRNRAAALIEFVGASGLVGAPVSRKGAVRSCARQYPAGAAPAPGRAGRTPDRAGRTRRAVGAVAVPRGGGFVGLWRAGAAA